MYKQYTCDSVIFDENPITFQYDNDIFQSNDPDWIDDFDPYPYMSDNVLIYSNKIDNGNERLGVTWNYITREIYAQIGNENNYFIVFDEYGQLKRTLGVYREYCSDHFILSKMNIFFIPWLERYCVGMYRCSDGSYISTLRPHCDTHDVMSSGIYMNETLNTLFVRLNETVVAYDFNV